MSTVDDELTVLLLKVTAVLSMTLAAAEKPAGDAWDQNQVLYCADLIGRLSEAIREVSRLRLYPEDPRDRMARRRKVRHLAVVKP
jgi:hypothetical protein